jgi:predicted amidohydrolase
MPAADAIHRELARRFGLHIIAGSGPLLGADGRYRNVARLFAPNGKSGVQEKLMLTPWERAWGLAAGRQPRVFDTALGPIAIAVCYDSEFPLNVRAQAEAGADLIAIPACTDALSGYSRVRTAALARALENQCATVLSSLSGAAPWCPAIDANVGAAGAYGPADHGVSDTGVLQEGKLHETGWVVTKIDLDAIRAARLTGGVRTFTHWAEQQGVRSLAPFAALVDLA